MAHGVPKWSPEYPKERFPNLYSKFKSSAIYRVRTRLHPARTDGHFPVNKMQNKIEEIEADELCHHICDLFLKNGKGSTCCYGLI